MLFFLMQDKLLLEAIELYGMENAKEIKKHLGAKSLSMKQVAFQLKF